MQFTKVHINTLLISLGLLVLAGGAGYILIHNDISNDRFMLVSWILKEIVTALVSYGKRFADRTIQNPAAQEE